MGWGVERGGWEGGSGGDGGVGEVRGRCVGEGGGEGGAVSGVLGLAAMRRSSSSRKRSVGEEGVGVVGGGRGAEGEGGSWVCGGLVVVIG